MRHLVSCFFILYTVLPIAASAAVSCNHVLLNGQTPSAIAVEQTLEALAKMKMTLDVAKSTGPHDIQFRALKHDFDIKRSDFQKQLNLSSSSLREMMRTKIVELQKKEGQEKKIEETKRNEVRDLIPNFQRTKRISSALGPKGILSASGKVLIQLYEYSLEARNLDTDLTYEAKFAASVRLSDRILMNQNGRWVSLDIETLKPTELVTTMPGKMAYVGITASQDKQSAVFYQYTSSFNYKKDHFTFQQFDRDGRIVDSGDLNLGVDVASVPYVGDKYWIIAKNTSEGSELYKFDVHSKTLKSLDAFGETVTPIPGTDKVIAASKHGHLYVIDLHTNQVLKQEFPIKPTVLTADSESILITLDYDGTFPTTFRLQVSDPSIFQEVLRGVQLVVQPIPGKRWVSAFERKFPTRKMPGVFGMNELYAPIFDFNAEYTFESRRFIHNQWISEDGKRIVNNVNTSDGNNFIDVWERP